MMVHLELNIIVTMSGLSERFKVYNMFGNFSLYVIPKQLDSID